MEGMGIKMEALLQYWRVFLFLGLGIMFLSGKGANLLAGYNTMKPEQKLKYNEKRWCKGVGWICVCAAIGSGFAVWFQRNNQNELADIMTPIMSIIVFAFICLFYFTNIFKSEK